MTEPNRPTFLRRKVGAKLRRLREEARLTLDEAAPKLDKTKSALQRVESGETRADVHLVRSMMDIYDRFEEGLLDEVREALRPPWYRPYSNKDMGYVDVETEAAQATQFALVNIPGLLQTEAYMRVLFNTRRSRNPRELHDHMAIRLIRQQRLTSEDRPLELLVVVYEAALRREIGGREVMREQLWHLVEMSAQRTVTLQVLPLGAGANVVPNGEVVLLGFPDPEDPELLYLEYPTGSLHIEDAAQVQKAKLMFDQLLTDALSVADSVALIERLANELDGPD